MEHAADERGGEDSETIDGWMDGWIGPVRFSFSDMKGGGEALLLEGWLQVFLAWRGVSERVSATVTED